MKGLYFSGPVQHDGGSGMYGNGYKPIDSALFTVPCACALHACMPGADKSLETLGNRAKMADMK